MTIPGSCGHQISGFRQGGVGLNAVRVTQTRPSVTQPDVVPLALVRAGGARQNGWAAEEVSGR